MNPVLENIIREDDKLVTPEIGIWSKKKHDLLEYYASMFSSSMRDKFYTVYLDLFASAGKARLKNSESVVPGSALRALAVKKPFHHYVFCEKDPECFSALQARSRCYFPGCHPSFYGGDANLAIPSILADLQKRADARNTLMLCFIDPFRAADLKFESIRRIAAYCRSDFLILLPSAMDVNRNEDNYLEEDSPVVDDLLGSLSWRAEWRDGGAKFGSFGYFVSQKFGQAMGSLGFPFDPAQNLVRMGMHGRKNSGPTLYYLGLFSKNPLAAKFWAHTKQGTDEQLGLGL